MDKIKNYEISTDTINTIQFKYCKYDTVKMYLNGKLIRSVENENGYDRKGYLLGVLINHYDNNHNHILSLLEHSDYNDRCHSIKDGKINGSVGFSSIEYVFNKVFNTELTYIPYVSEQNPIYIFIPNKKVKFY